MARTRLEHSELQALTVGVLKAFDMLDRGQVTAEEMRERSAGTAAEALIELAIELHNSPQTIGVVAEPRYRKGTGRKPVQWSECLWQPKQ